MRRGGPFLACALILACTDLGNLSGGGTADGGADASPPEAGTTPDAAVTEAGTRFCDTKTATTIFCDDFDDPGRTSVSAAGWVTPVGGAADGVLATDRVFSAPRSVLFRYGPDAGAMRSASETTLALPAAKSTVAVTARIYYVAGSDRVEMDLQLGDFDARYEAAKSDIITYVGPSQLDSVSTGAAAADGWRLVRISIERIPASSTMRVTARIGEGAAAVENTGDVNVGPGPADAVDANVIVRLGNGGNDTTGTVYFDDVRVETF